MVNVKKGIKLMVDLKFLHAVKKKKKILHLLALIKFKDEPLFLLHLKPIFCESK